MAPMGGGDTCITNCEGVELGFYILYLYYTVTLG